MTLLILFVLVAAVPLGLALRTAEGRAAAREAAERGALRGISWGATLAIVALVAIGLGDYLRTRTGAARGEAAAAWIERQAAQQKAR